MFGPNLLVEFSGCPYDRLADKELITETLKSLPDKMEMTRITEPMVMYYSGLHEEDHGLTGVVIIAESHICIHTFPKKGFMTIDIFSCKQFDVSFVMNELVSIFDPKRWDETLLQRGREFPRSMAKAEIIVSAAREDIICNL